jgi:hypothetical protein
MQATALQHSARPCPLVSPFLLRGSNETFLGSVVLEEREGSLAMLLWQSLRAARPWAAVPGGSGAALPPRRSAALRDGQEWLGPAIRLTTWVSSAFSTV